jgi:ABC-type phosphate transport system permease subunit
MVMPYIMSVAREVLLAVPDTQREAALALGATRWEAVITRCSPTPAPASSAPSSSAWAARWARRWR